MRSCMAYNQLLGPVASVARGVGAAVEAGVGRQRPPERQRQERQRPWWGKAALLQEAVRKRICTMPLAEQRRGFTNPWQGQLGIRN